MPMIRQKVRQTYFPDEVVQAPTVSTQITRHKHQLDMRVKEVEEARGLSFKESMRNQKQPFGEQRILATPLKKVALTIGGGIAGVGLGIFLGPIGMVLLGISGAMMAANTVKDKHGREFMHMKVPR